MKLSDINPHIRYASIHYNHIEKTFDSICYDCRLFYIKEGSGYVIANEQQYSFSDHTAIFFPAGTHYHFYPDRSCKSFISVVINFDLTNESCHLERSLGTASTQNFDPSKVISQEAPSEFSGILTRQEPSIMAPLTQCCEEFLTQSPLYRETASSLLKFCLIQLVRSKIQNREFTKVSPVLEYIHTHYSDTTLNNESIARLFNYHPYYLSQIIRSQTGQSLHQYLISYRIKMAKKKLITTDDDINTVAWKSGFQSPSYFIKQFKAHVGVTPSAYRKQRIDFYF